MRLEFYFNAGISSLLTKSYSNSFGKMCFCLDEAVMLFFLKRPAVILLILGQFFSVLVETIFTVQILYVRKNSSLIFLKV